MARQVVDLRVRRGARGVPVGTVLHPLATTAHAACTVTSSAHASATAAAATRAAAADAAASIAAASVAAAAVAAPALATASVSASAAAVAVASTDAAWLPSPTSAAARAAAAAVAAAVHVCEQHRSAGGLWPWDQARLRRLGLEVGPVVHDEGLRGGERHHRVEGRHLGLPRPERRADQRHGRVGRHTQLPDPDGPGGMARQVVDLPLGHGARCLRHGNVLLP